MGEETDAPAGRRGTLATIARNCYRPRWWVDTAAPHLAGRAMHAYFDRFPRERCDVMDEDWDTLLLLDACRYDLFEAESDVEGLLERRVSRGSSTGEFFEENFLGTRHHDTVYVTANPVPRVEKWCRVDVDSVFHDVVDVWEEHWDADLNTVRPERVARAVDVAREEYPRKRIVGHFVQPHQPFIGERGRSIEEGGMTAYDELADDADGGGDADDAGDADGTGDAAGAGEADDARKKVWERLEDGELSADRVWDAYRENLSVVLPCVEELCEELAGKTVVTSDHGNLLGEFAWPFPIRGYGHPRGVHTRKLVRVPWLEVDCDERPTIVSEPPVESEAAADDEERLERLQALGYH